MLRQSLQIPQLSDGHAEHGQKVLMQYYLLVSATELRHRAINSPKSAGPQALPSSLARGICSNATPSPATALNR